MGAEPSDGPRLAPLAPGDWPPEMRAALGALVPPTPRHPLPERRGDRPKGLNLLGTFAHHPELIHAYHTFTGHVLYGTTLPLRTRELLVLRVAAVRAADYEWAQHVAIGTDVGLTRAEIDRIVVGPDAAGWTDADRALLRAVDELVADARIGDATWQLLVASGLDTQQLMDVVFTVGCYDLLAMALRSFGVELDDDLAEWK